VDEGDYIEHAEFSWLYVGAIESVDSMWFYSELRGAWIWSSVSLFPIFFDSNTGGYVYFMVLEEGGLLIYDYSTGTWTVVND
jgi:hypothetical protein